ncbi:glycoside hydrolase family 88 protein [Robertmurraya sp. GLU-23]
MLYFFVYIVLMLVLVVFIIDTVPIIKNWLGRIKIGKYEDPEVWSTSIRKKAVDWLLKTPKIKVTDNSRLIIIDMLNGNYTKNAIQHWQQAALIFGLGEYLKTTDDPTIKKAIHKFLDSTFDSNGQWRQEPRHIDVAILAYAIMKLNFININKYKKAFDAVWDLIMKHKGHDGTIYYRETMKQYRYVDTIGFICPFLIKYGVMYKKEECIELALYQIKNYELYGVHNLHAIPVHAYHIETKMPLGLYGWGRGLGWYAIGLIDSWNELPFKKKPELETLVVKFAKSIIEYQQQDGSWGWTVSRRESTKDSSTAAALGWFLINAGKINEISDQCFNSAEKAVSYLMKVTRRSGEIDFSQGDTKDIGVYSNSFSILPFTQGFSVAMINRFHMLNSSKSSKSRVS